MEIKTIIRTMLCVGFMALLPAASCNNNAGKVTPAPPVITDQSGCEAACANLQRLTCDEGRPINMGTKCVTQSDCKGPTGVADPRQECVSGTCITSCTNFCIETENQGVWLDPHCVAQITKCDQIDSCPLPTKPGPTCEGPACPPDIRTK